MASDGNLSQADIDAALAESAAAQADAEESTKPAAGGFNEFSQADIDSALAEAGMQAEANTPAAEKPGSDVGSALSQSDIDAALEQALSGAPAAGSPEPAKAAPAPETPKPAAPAPASPSPDTRAFELPDIAPAKTRDPAKSAAISLLHDVDLKVEIELGRTWMRVEDVLRLSHGSVVELDKLAGDPVDVYVNGRLVAKGEVLVLNDTFCVRVNEILTPPSRVAS